MSSEMSEYAMVVPTAANTGEPHDRAIFDQLEAALDEQFGGFTRHNDLTGSWRSDRARPAYGQRETLVEYRIASPGATEIVAIAVWTGQRVDQREIYVRLPSGRVLFLAPRLFHANPVVRRSIDYALPAEAIVNLLRLPAHRELNGQPVLSFAVFDEELHELPMTLTPIELAGSRVRTSGGRAVLSSFGTRLEFVEASSPIQANVDALIAERIDVFSLDSRQASMGCSQCSQFFTTDLERPDCLLHAI